MTVQTQDQRTRRSFLWNLLFVSLGVAGVLGLLFFVRSRFHQQWKRSFLVGARSVEACMLQHPSKASDKAFLRAWEAQRMARRMAFLPSTSESSFWVYSSYVSSDHIDEQRWMTLVGLTMVSLCQRRHVQAKRFFERARKHYPKRPNDRGFQELAFKALGQMFAQPRRVPFARSPLRVVYLEYRLTHAVDLSVLRAVQGLGSAARPMIPSLEKLVAAAFSVDKSQQKNLRDEEKVNRMVVAGQILIALGKPRLALLPLLAVLNKPMPGFVRYLGAAHYLSRGKTHRSPYNNPKLRSLYSISLAVGGLHRSEEERALKALKKLCNKPDAIAKTEIIAAWIGLLDASVAEVRRFGARILRAWGVKAVPQLKEALAQTRDKAERKKLQILLDAILAGSTRKMPPGRVPGLRTLTPPTKPDPPKMPMKRGGPTKARLR